MIRKLAASRTEAIIESGGNVFDLAIVAAGFLPSSRFITVAFCSVSCASFAL